jgi:hypothetical protein
MKKYLNEHVYPIYDDDIETPKSDYNGLDLYGSDNDDIALDTVLDFNDAIFNRIEPIIIDAVPPIYEPTIQTQAVMKIPYYKLEILGSLCMSVLLCSNSFLIAAMGHYYATNTDPIIQYFLVRLIHFMVLGFVMFIFTTTDTYKSINITTDMLGINSIIYNYNTVTILNFIAIQFICAILGAFFTYGLFFYVLNDISTKQLLSAIFLRSRDYSFNISRILISLLAHIFLSSGLTILVNTTNTINIRSRVLHKILFIFTISIIFGIFTGPIGYIWYNLSLYCVISIVRSDGFELFNINLFFNYLGLLLSILFIYPIVAVQIKFNLWNKYRNYIEYKK